MNITLPRAVIEQALEALEWEFGLNPVGKKTHETITALRTALAQQYMTNAAGELEPVTVVQTGVGIGKPVQEPVAWRFQSAVGGWAYGSEPPLGSKYPAYPLYTAPPQRKPLTEEEIRQIALDTPIGGTNFARAIERAHGIGGDE